MNNIETQNLYQNFLTERAKIKEMEKIVNQNKSFFSNKNSDRFHPKNTDFNKANTNYSPLGINSYKGKYKVKGDKRNFGSPIYKPMKSKSIDYESSPYFKEIKHYRSGKNEKDLLIMSFNCPELKCILTPPKKR